MNTPNTYKPAYKPMELAISKQWLITVLLLSIMALTRAGYVAHIQDASWSIFFLIGFYLRSYIGLPIIILSALVIDFAMIAARGGHQDYYLTPSYLFIIPAYAALWFAGRFFAAKYSENIKGLMTLIGTAFVGIVACDLISSGGFYWISADAVDLTFKEFYNRTIDFMPLYLKTALFYLSITTITHLAFLQAGKFSSLRKTHST